VPGAVNWFMQSAVNFCELADTVGATEYVVNFLFGGFKRINDFQMAREVWDNCLDVSLKLEGHLTRRRCAQGTLHQAY
jgi:hypothetical protein